jgi:hypothetical protein
VRIQIRRLRSKSRCCTLKVASKHLVRLSVIVVDAPGLEAKGVAEAEVASAVEAEAEEVEMEIISQCTMSGETRTAGLENCKAVQPLGH